MNKLPERKRTRLRGFDYSSDGMYFLTICVNQRKNILSEIVFDSDNECCKSALSEYGIIVDDIIRKISERYAIELINYVIMPNHVHLIVMIHDSKLSSTVITHSVIANIVGYIKMNASKKIHSLGYEEKIWQRSYHDHIIRDYKDFDKIDNYITMNPQNWNNDCFY